MQKLTIISFLLLPICNVSNADVDLKSYFKNNFSIKHYHEGKSDSGVLMSTSSTEGNLFFSLKDIRNTSFIDKEIKSIIPDYVPEDNAEFYISGMSLRGEKQIINYGLRYFGYIVEDWNIGLSIYEGSVTGISLNVYNVELNYDNNIRDNSLISEDDALKIAQYKYEKSKKEFLSTEVLYSLKISSSKPYAIYEVQYDNGYKYKINALTGDIISEFNGIYL